MAKCACCGSTVVFGGQRVDALTFCNRKCLAKGHVVVVAGQVPEDVAREHALAVHSGSCPVCNKRRGPVELHTSYKVSSFLVMTSWASMPRVSCNSCGKKAQLGAAAHSLLLGWWGLPWGLIITPVQLARNIAGLLHTESSLQPSEKLKQHVKMCIASHLIEENNRRAADTG